MNPQQQIAFDNQFTRNFLTAEEIASELNVSTASVRNWIKAGDLEKIGRNKISVESYESFKASVAGKRRLNKRANKSHKDTYDPSTLLGKIDSELSKDNPNYTEIIAKYINTISDSYKNKEGVYYTPRENASEFFHAINQIEENIDGKKFLDPCCGSGEFIISAIENGISPSNVYGVELDPIAFKISKQRLCEKYGVPESNIINGDFLSAQVVDEVIKKTGTVDILATNPPWGKKFSKAEVEEICRQLNCVFEKESSALFFHASKKVVSQGGYIGLLVQDAFFNIASHKKTREEILSFNVISFFDFGKLFNGLVTNAKGFLIQLQPAKKGKIVVCKKGEEIWEREQDTFIANPKNIINFTLKSEEGEVIKYLYTLPHTTLSGNARYGLGIVTGNNKEFIYHRSGESLMPVYKGSDITASGLKEASIFIPKSLHLYQQVAPEELYLSSVKLIYKFISNRLVFCVDRMQSFILNSANMLIVNDDFPLTHQQLCDLLNSNFINWVFTSIFNTHKVLRSDIEQLPIHAEFFEKTEKFEESKYLKFLGLEETKNGTYRIKK